VLACRAPVVSNFSRDQLSQLDAMLEVEVRK